MMIWILVYSPITNEHLIKLAYFKYSTELESFVTTNRDSIYIHHFETVNFEVVIEGNK